MDAKNKSLFLKSAYYRSFGFIIAGIVGFIFSLNSLIKTVNDYPFIQGKIVDAHIRWNDAPYSIKLESNLNNWYRIYYRKVFPILKEKAVPGKEATIWYGEGNLIEQLVVEDEVVYPYSKATLLWIILMAFGLFMSVGNIYYLVKYPHHARGEEIKKRTTILDRF